jgi:signal transduction histidine kinase
MSDLLLKNFTVLYVEDTPVMQKLVALMLKPNVKELYLASDGLEGLQAFKEKKPDIVLTDIEMPNMDGLEMARQIKQIDYFQPVILLSGYSSVDIFEQSINIGIDQYIVKPVKDKSKLIDPLEALAKTLQTKKDNEELEDLVHSQSKLAAMGEMMDAIAHQWKQPLNIISMETSELQLQAHLGCTTANNVRASVQTIDLQVAHLIETIDEFREYFRPNQKTEKVEVAAEIDKVFALIKNDLVVNTVETAIEGDRTLTADILPTEFKHVIINLVKNAIDAFLDNGIRERKITCALTTHNGFTRVDVQDSAGGIPEKIIHDIFKANFTTKEKGKGTGVGLYMSKMIIEKIRGEISVANRNEGACFTILLPNEMLSS